MDESHETFLISAPMGALNGLIPQAAQQMSRGWVFEGDLRKLHENLTSLQAFLRDAEKITRLQLIPPTHKLKQWLETLKPVISRSEDMLDELGYEADRRKFEVDNRMRNKVRDFFSLSNPLAFSLKVVHRLKRFNLLLDRICQQADGIGLRPVDNIINDELADNFTDDDVVPKVFCTTEPSVDDSKVLGRDRDVSIVRDMLLRSDENLSIVSIVGMVGVGKTTLAQQVYKDQEVFRKFGDKRMWVCASNDFNVPRVLNEMMQSLTRGQRHTSYVHVERIVSRLRNELGGVKYLLVLDDIWNTRANKWIYMIHCLLRIGGSKGSKILVTTQIRTLEAVLAIQKIPYLTHNLGELSGDDSWTLFRKIAFAERGPRETHILDEIGRRVVEKCMGLPFLIKSVANLLYSKKDEKQWVSIENNETWSSVLNEIGFLPLLRKNFDRLPSPTLKRCFAYCSVFPKGSVIKKDELIQLWMNLGYLHPPLGSNLEMEDVGNDYFVTLLGNFLFQDVEMDEYKNRTSCKMSDLVHDLAVDVLEGHHLSLEPSKTKYLLEVQHLSLDFWRETSFEFPKGNVEKLRTILPKIVVDVDCTLALGLFGEEVEKLPSSIRKLVRLRYLDLSETSIEKLPNFITKLYNLQTLKLPRDLIELPKDFHKLVSLRHYCMADTIKTRKLLPMKIGQLTCLQTLPFFVVGEGSGHRIEELGSLSKLRGRLHIYNLQHVKDAEEAKKANISAKSGIQELGFHWENKVAVEGDTNTSNNGDVLEGLQPHTDIRGLILENFGGRSFPSWMMSVTPPFLLKLVKIELRDCLCEQVPSLGHLPYLEIIEMVRLKNLKHIDLEFYDYNGGGALAAVAFPALRKLTLDGMPLEEWSLPADTSKTVVFPRLEELHISDCPQLIDIPGHLLSIQELTISSINLSNAESGKRCYPSLTICSTYWESEKMDVLMEDLLEKSSKSLRNLTIRGLTELCSLPNKLWNLVSLEKLEIIECPNLMSDIKGKGFNGLASLQQVSIKQCENLTRLPEGLIQDTLVTLELDRCPRITAELCNLTSLVNLLIRGCPSLLSCWEDRLFSPKRLQRLEIGGFSEELQSFPWPFTSAAASAANANVGIDIQYCLQCGADIQHCLQCGNSLSRPSTSTSIAAAKQPQQFFFMSLRSLHLWGWEKLAHLPEGLQHLTTLRELSIHSFDLLQALPDWLANIASLQSLAVYNCKNLMSFPKVRLAFLLFVTIDNCPQLRKRCKKGVGPEWSKIAHVPSVNISFSTRGYA